MARNMGTWDRRLRGFVIAPAALVLAAVVGLGSIPGLALLALAAVMAVTAAVGYCPLYALVGLSTCPVRRVRST